MTKKQLKLPLQRESLINWSEMRHEGKFLGHQGLLTEGLKHPYRVTITPKNAWHLWHYDHADDKKIVARGSAKNVEAAKLDAARAALAKIPEYKRLQQAAKAEQNQAAKAEPVTVSARRGSVRMLAMLMILIGGSILVFYYWFRYAPKSASVTFAVFVVLLFAAIQALRGWDWLRSLWERATKRKQLNQARQAVQARVPARR